MVTREQLVNGIMEYIDEEVIPALPTVGKWGLGTIVLVSSERYDDIINALMKNSYVKMLGVINDDGLIDIEAVTSALKKSASKYGKMTFQLPIIGNLTFDENDVENLRQHIIGGAK